MVAEPCRPPHLGFAWDDERPAPVGTGRS